MLKKAAIIAVLVFLSANIYGCVPLLAGAAGGVGTATWLSGKLSQEFEAPFDRTLKAVESALKSLKLEITEKTVKKDVAQVMSKYTDGRTIWIDIRPISRRQSQVEVRVGALGDKEAAELIIARIKRYL
jgi:hypothetical protein